ncbi:hypothetical protein Glove_22g143 [Diversispora epigaea]|uniref:Uncharacterized protein n=1 Tax=Diversispora epigaea TaxID=1348612 RepID=A0A397JLJ2_9GLOM|nr:hypothetical protein Glove_22g143 [Diversispora epigaea]
MNKSGWKYSKKRLVKHKFCATIINPKKVVCICGKIIKLNRKWDENYRNRYANGNGCKRKSGQQSIYCFFDSNKNDVISSEEKYDSDICDNIDNDDIITIDSNKNDNNNSDDILSSEDEDQSNKEKSRKRIHFGSTRRIEIIGKELFPLLFTENFSKKKLNTVQKRKLNRQIYAEAKWKIDREGNCVHAKNCNSKYTNENLCIEYKQIKSNIKLANCVRVKKPDEKNLKFTPNFYFENDKLKKYLKNADLLTIWNIIKNNKSLTNSNLWITIANKGLKEVFTNSETFKSLCSIMCQIADRKEKNMKTQNLKYSEEFTNFLIVLGTISPYALDLFRQNLAGHGIQNLCFENVARFKRFLDKINYKGPSLRYSSQLGCVIGSTLSQEETKINIYNDIPKIIQSIKNKKEIANYVRVYILQVPLPKFPPVIIALISNNGKDSAETIANLHKKLILEIAPQLNISILSIGSDGAASEFRAQSIIMNTRTTDKIEITNRLLNINFSCPVFFNVGPVIQVQNPKHAKKTARNIVMSGARVLTFGQNIINFEHFLQLVNLPSSVLFKNDIIKLDRQDDGAAY